MWRLGVEAWWIALLPTSPPPSSYGLSVVLTA